MFHVDGARSVAVHPHQPARASFGADASSMLADHLDTLLGEHLLPLRIRQADEDAPYLLAVDASGQPVVVEVVALLDEVAVMRALRYAGRAAGMSTQDLAAAYSGGAQSFARHLAAFRETVPATALLSTSVRGGSRLLLVCSELDDGMDDVVDFLLQPGAQIEVLQVGVIAGADGARIVDVSPLRRSSPARRAMEPTPLRLVRSGEMPVVREAAGAGAAEGVAVAGVAAAGAGVAGNGAVAGGREASPAEAVSMLTETAAWELAVGQTNRPPTPIATVSAPPRRESVLRREPPAQPEPPARSEAPAGPDALARVVGDAREVDDLPLVGSGDADQTRVIPVVPAASASVPYAFTGVAPTPGADPALLSVARGLGEPTVLVWSRHRRGETYEALLHLDGFIELPDGSRHRDPHSAASEVSRSDATVDGWNVWRVGADGPRLRELHPDPAARTRR